MQRRLTKCIQLKYLSKIFIIIVQLLIFSVAYNQDISLSLGHYERFEKFYVPPANKRVL